MIVLRCTNDDGTKADLEVLGNEIIRLDISAIESAEIGDVFGVSSQEFTLPGTKTNQDFFGYLDNLGSTPGVALNKSVPCQVLNDGMEVFTGKLYITNIVTNQKGDTLYNVVVVNETVDFKIATQDIYLGDLDFSAYDHTLSYNNITASWTGSGLFNGDIIYPLVEYGSDSADTTSTQIVAGGKSRNFDNSSSPLKVTDFKPAVRLKTVIDTIFDTVNYSYSSSFFDTADFQNIYMLSTQDDKNGLTFVNPVSQSFQINKTGDSDQSVSDNVATKVIFGNEVFDNANNVTTSKFTADVDGLYTFYTAVKYGITGGVDSLPDALEMWFYANGSEIPGANTSVLIKGTETGIAYLGPVSLNLTAGDEIEVYITRTYETGLGSRVFRIIGSANSKFEGIGPNTVQSGTVNMNKIFDPKAKALDLLNGIIQKFNLVVEPIKGERNVLRIEPFNDWVDLGVTRDWTDKVDRSVKFSIKHPLQNQPKVVKFSDVEDSDSINKYTQDKFGKVYGEYTYESESDLADGEKSVGSFFAPTPMKYIDGAPNMVVPGIFQRDNGNERNAFKFKPRLFYNLGLQDCPPQLRGYNTGTSQYNYGNYFIEDESGTVHQLNQWLLFHHNNAFPAVFDTTNDLHFGNLNQWSYHQKQFNARAKNSAFFKYWAFYINELYDVDARLLTCNVILEPHELPQIQLNDKIFIDGHYYRINKINGANLMNEDSIEVELIKSAPRKLYYPRRKRWNIDGTLGDVYFDWDTIDVGGTGVYNDYVTDLPITSSIGTPAARDGFALYGDIVTWDTVKPVQYVETQQEIQGNSTLDPSANFVKVTGDNNSIKSSTQKVSVVGDNNTIQEYAEYITVDGTLNTVEREVNNVSMLNATSTTVGQNSSNVTLLNTLNTVVTASDQVVVISDVGSDVDNGDSTGTTTLMGTRNVAISGSTNDVTIIGSENIAVTGGNFHVVIGKDDELSGSLDLNRYRFNTNVLNDTYLDDGVYFNKDSFNISAASGSYTYAYSGEGLYKYAYDITWVNPLVGGIHTIELPGIVSQQQEGRTILFKCDDSITSTSSIYIESVAGTDNIDGSNRYILNNPYQWVELRASYFLSGEGYINEWRVINEWASGSGGGGGTGSVDYISNVTFSTPASMSFTGVGSAFSGVVDFSTATVASSSFATSASHAISSSFATSSSYAITASYVENANTASYAQYSANTIVYGKNLSGGTIIKGTPLYFTGSGTSGNIVGVYPADAGNPDRMPAGGIAGEQMLDEDEGIVLLDGFINGVDTSLFNSGDEVYVAVGGGYTNVRPTGSANFVQALGYVEKVDASNGSGVIHGPGNPYDLPNIQSGYFWVGDADGVPQSTPTSSLSLSAFPYSGSAQITGSLGLTGSFSQNVQTITVTTSSTTASINCEQAEYFNINLQGTFDTASLLNVTNFKAGQEITVKINQQVTPSSQNAYFSSNVVFPETLGNYGPTLTSGSYDFVYMKALDTSSIYAFYEKNFNVTASAPPSSYTLEFLVVGGGGGGGGHSNNDKGGAGGGAGGFLSSSFSTFSGINYSCSVGSGGAGGNSSGGLGSVGGDGTTSWFSSSAVYTALGGGGGAAGSGGSGQPEHQGRNGGSGGGATRGGSGGIGLQPTSSFGGYGEDGGSTGPYDGGSGGGGADPSTGTGTSTTSAAGGAGGSGYTWLDGVAYAGGGGGGAYSGAGGAGGTGGGGAGGNANADGTQGTDGLGGGGGGAGGGPNAGRAGADGGDGVVIVRYAGSQVGSGGTVTSAGGYTYHTFTGSGIFTS